jgi:uncharacterized YigZ family protein
MSYYTIQRIGRGEYEEKRSRFLGEAIPISKEEEAAEHLSRIRKQYYDARHHCSAYVLGENRDRKRASDDGEPQGTAGLPILNVLEGAECTGVLIVVTRYFGGTLLGTGGLVRAYTNAAKAALEAAGPVCMQEGEILELGMDYSFLSSVRYYLEKEGIKDCGTEYMDRVLQKIVVPAGSVEKVRNGLRELSKDKIQVNSVEKGFYGFDIGPSGD